MELLKEVKWNFLSNFTVYKSVYTDSDQVRTIVEMMDSNEMYKALDHIYPIQAN